MLEEKEDIKDGICDFYRNLYCEWVAKRSPLDGLTCDATESDMARLIGLRGILKSIKLEGLLMIVRGKELGPRWLAFGFFKANWVVVKGDPIQVFSEICDMDEL